MQKVITNQLLAELEYLLSHTNTTKGHEYTINEIKIYFADYTISHYFQRLTNDRILSNRTIQRMKQILNNLNDTQKQELLILYCDYGTKQYMFFNQLQYIENIKKGHLSSLEITVNATEHQTPKQFCTTLNLFKIPEYLFINYMSWKDQKKIISSKRQIQRLVKMTAKITK